MLADNRLLELPEDVYSLFNPDVDHIPSEENLQAFADSVVQLLKTRLGKQERGRNPLRFSSLGKPDRQLWMQANPDPDNPPEEMLPKTYIKFLYGDLIEQMLLFLVKEAGHTVEMEQSEVEIDGVLGHIDAKVDGTIIDVKSASPYGYAKFKENSVLGNDSFGYVEQLAGYSNVLTPGMSAAWIAMDKVHGDICVSVLPKTVVSHYQPEERIAHLRNVIFDPDNMPEQCYPEVPDGASGNMKLDTGCSYCAFKKRCFPNVRTFIYSTGPRYLTKVERLPKVPEIIS